jgi:cytoskeletal protein RodZ
MKLFSRDKNQNVPADLEPYMTGVNNWRMWVRRIVAIVVLIVLVAAVVWAGVKVYSSVVDDNTEMTKPIGQAAKGQEKKQKSDSKVPAKNTNGAAPEPKRDQAAPATIGTPLPKTGDDHTTQPVVLPATGG